MPGSLPPGCTQRDCGEDQGLRFQRWQFDRKLSRWKGADGQERFHPSRVVLWRGGQYAHSFVLLDELMRTRFRRVAEESLRSWAWATEATNRVERVSPKVENTPGGILNAYRKGRLTFEAAVERLESWKAVQP